MGNILADNIQHWDICILMQTGRDNNLNYAYNLLCAKLTLPTQNKDLKIITDNSIDTYVQDTEVVKKINGNVLRRTQNIKENILIIDKGFCKSGVQKQ